MKPKILKWQIFLFYQFLNSKKKKKIAESFKIEGLQKFEQYTTINPVNVEIINPYPRNKLLFYSSNYKCNLDLLLIVYFLVQRLHKKQTLFLLLPMNYNMLMNGKLFQGIKAIYISEIENWDRIKNKSHWLNVKRTDSLIPIAAKHFAFVFETQDFNNLLKFEYSLLNNKGELLKFADGKTKIPALNFSIQVVY